MDVCLFVYYWKGRKETLAIEQPTYPKSWVSSFFDPCTNLLLYVSHSTAFQSLDDCVFLFHLLLSEREGSADWVASLRPWNSEEYSFSSSSFFFFTSCCLFFMSVPVSCLLQLRSLNSSRGHVMFKRSLPCCIVWCCHAMGYQMVARHSHFRVWIRLPDIANKNAGVQLDLSFK